MKDFMGNVLVCKDCAKELVKCGNCHHPICTDCIKQSREGKLLCKSCQSFHIVLDCVEAIHKKHPAKESIIDEMECPVCGGVLRYSKAECNGHVHGKCDTDTCLYWME